MPTATLKAFVSLALLNLFLLLQIVSICPELHHRLNSASGVSEQRAGTAPVGGDVETAVMVVAVAPECSTLILAPDIEFTFHSSWDFRLSPGRGPPLFHS